MNERINKELNLLIKPLSGFREDPQNARKHDEKNIQSIMDSYRQFGQQKPLVALKDGTLVAGSGTLEALKRMGWECAAIVIFDSTDPSQAIGYGIADNRTGELAQWDRDILGNLLNGLKPDISLTSLGFDEKELSFFDKLMAPPEGTDELKEPWTTCPTCKRRYRPKKKGQESENA